MTIRQRIVQDIVFYRMYRLWKRTAIQVAKSEYHQPATPSLVIVPCDLWAVGGSRGDEAMLMGVINRYRQLYPQIPIHIVCANEGVQYIKDLPFTGISPIPSWNDAYSTKAVYRSIIDAIPSDVIILGADCMDGFYSPTLSLELLSLHDLCSKTPNLRSRLLGFSFNASPSWLMVRAFRSLSSDIKICLRDSVSLSRYQKKVNRPASLVADAAFLLQPDANFPLYEEIKTWTDTQRTNGQTIIGLNFHPMLRTYSDSEDIKSDAMLLAKNIERILAQYSEISFVFIPHDDRSRLTDNLMLSTMYAYLKELKINSGRVFYSPDVPRAPQLKALCGLLDGLISSRMHLAIAALGMKAPVLAATYQGKFEGLFQHFGLDETYLLNPKRFLSDDMISTFGSFIKRIPELKRQISERLPLVQELSNANFEDE